jgi:60 kDa SS-A/Ro ribonucleoprotein
MANYAQHVSRKVTPQTEPIPGSAQVENSAGGFVYALDDWGRLDRFLILGADGGTYYASERKLTRENAACVERCRDADPARTVARIVEISDAGRAPKNDPAIFALALCTLTHPGVMACIAQNALERVCRTGTHLFQFVSTVDELRGTGRGLKSLVCGWYDHKDPNDLAFQVTKYVSRDKMSHSNVIKGYRPHGPTPAHGAVYRWVVRGVEGLAPRTVDRSKGGGGVKEYPGFAFEDLPRWIRVYEEVKGTKDVEAVVRLIRDQRVPREFLEGSHSEMLNRPEVWDAMLPSMPLHAMVRNLGKMSTVGLLKPLSATAKTVTDRLGDAEYIRKSRMHPIALLMAMKVYNQGRGLKGSNTWTPVPQVTDALDAAFYTAFQNVVPAGKRTLIGLDVSGSMSSPIAGTALSCAEGAAAMGMVTFRTEPWCHLMAFCNQFVRLDITPRARLTDVVRETARMNFGSTDCSLPMLYAMQEKLEVDTFVVITDNETYAGSMHPSQALKQYRQKSGIPAREIVMGMTATNFTIADPNDPLTLDVVGFDSATPALVADFSRGFDAPAEKAG